MKPTYSAVLTAVKRALRPQSEAGQDYALSLLQKHGYRTERIARHYAWGEGSLPVVLVAHTDTVHGEAPAVVHHDPRAGVLWAPDGLGADDRAGVAAIDLLLSMGLRPSVLFTDGEEVGGRGSAIAATQIDPGSARVVIQIDRRGADDAVYYHCHNPALEAWVTAHGFRTEQGTFTDIVNLCPAWGIAGVNLSAGYYHEHRGDEFLRLRELRRTVQRVASMLRDLPKERFAYAERFPELGRVNYPLRDRNWRREWKRDAWRGIDDECPWCGAELMLTSERNYGACAECMDRISAVSEDKDRDTLFD